MLTIATYVHIRLLRKLTGANYLVIHSLHHLFKIFS